MEVIENIINEIKTKGLLPAIRRYQYMPYSLTKAMQIIEAIGKERSPKFVIDNENRFVYENLIRWVQGDPDFKCIDPENKTIIPGNLNKGIYLAGNTGSGKSWALEILSAFTMVDNIQVQIGKYMRALRWSCFRADDICEDYLETGKLDKYKKLSIICIQDLGAEPKECVHMGNRINVLRQILEARGDRPEQITLISSNYSFAGKFIKDYYADRVVSRLWEMCNYLELKGQDRRITKFL